MKNVGLFKLLGVEGSTNATGDAVKKLDVIANEAFITSLKRSLRVKFRFVNSSKRMKVSVMVSEENENIITVEGSTGLLL